MGSTKIKILKDLFLNFTSGNRYELSYIVEAADWVVKEIGRDITSNLNKAGRVKSRTTTSSLGLKNQIVHFGSVNSFIKEEGIEKVHKSNKVVLTWFHILPDDKRIKFIPELNNKVDIVHASCNLTKDKLIQCGLNKEKITVIPLGVDLNLFKPISEEKKQRLREKMGIPSHKIIIGSFQKDGVGWGKGLEPKLIKGPDIFVKVVEKLSNNHPIFVLLVGPARGYVKKELKERNVPYKDIGYLKDPKEVAKYYQALDLYLIASRIEGGPKQILDSWASGVPIVSTKVGMIPDIVGDEEDILLAEIEDVEQLTIGCRRVMEDKELRERLIKSHLERVKDYSWEKISERYFREIYSKL